MIVVWYDTGSIAGPLVCCTIIAYGIVLALWRNPRSVARSSCQLVFSTHGKRYYFTLLELY